MLSADKRGGAPGREQRARHRERGEEQLLEQVREGGLRRDKPLEVERRPQPEQCGEARAERGEPDTAEGGAEHRERAGGVPEAEDGGGEPDGSDAHLVPAQHVEDVGQHRAEGDNARD